MRLVREHQFAGRAVLPGDGVPGLHLVGGDLDVAPFHGAVVVGAREGFCLRMKWYTILGREKGIGGRIWEILGCMKEGRWTWLRTTFNRSHNLRRAGKAPD
jgi:hypothetical protein